MKNKIKLKRFLLISLIISICLFIFFLYLNIREYQTYNYNLNRKITSIISVIEEKYPDVDKNAIMELLNDDEVDENILDAYSIDIDEDAILLENKQAQHEYMIIQSLFYIGTIIVLIFVFLIFNDRKDKEVQRITRCIEEINRKNYHMNLGDISEDELSILKNEIYKTTLMLKEEAENNKKEKIELKDSLSDISHQLKTPLTSILIALDNLIDDPDMEKEVREDFIRDIKREISNVSFLVQSILKLSKLDTNTVVFIEEEVSVKRIIEKAMQNLAMLCDLKNIKLSTNVQDDESIICDFKWQVEAISNIVKNCIEHADANSVVEIKVSDHKVYVSILIRNHGETIDAKDLPHIFERFYKGKNAKEDSIGIGLSLAKTIIEKDNGTLSVESVDHVTTFMIKYFR